MSPPAYVAYVAYLAYLLALNHLSLRPMSSMLLSRTLSSMRLPITLSRLLSMTLWQSRSQANAEANIYDTFLPE